MVSGEDVYVEILYYMHSHFLLLYVCICIYVHVYTGSYVYAYVYIYIGRCANRGKSVAKSVTKNSNQSSKCDCKAKFTFISSTGEIKFVNDHDALCEPLSSVEMNNSAQYYRCLQSPHVKAESLVFAAELKKRDYGIKNTQVKRQVEGDIESKMKKNNVTYEKPPDAYLNRMMKLAEESMNSKVVPSEALNTLIEQFKVEGVPYSVLNSNGIP
jgi:hypothetical protein